MNGIDLVAFDMAGTTVEEGGRVYLALGDALSENGVDFDEDELRAWMGASKLEVLNHFVCREGTGRDGADEALVRRAYSTFKDALRHRYTEGEPVRPMPSAEETFARLRERGVKVALTTGFDREIADALLARLNWSGSTVDAVVCGEDVRRGRPAPYMVFRAMERTGVLDVSRVAVVGDTALDLRAGTNAGAGLVVGVLSGGGDPGPLGAERHTHLVSNVGELPALLDREPARGQRASGVA